MHNSVIVRYKMPFDFVKTASNKKTKGKWYDIRWSYYDFGLNSFVGCGRVWRLSHRINSDTETEIKKNDDNDIQRRIKPKNFEFMRINFIVQQFFQHNMLHP